MCRLNVARSSRGTLSSWSSSRTPAGWWTRSRIDARIWSRESISKFQASRIIWRSPTFVPVGPVWMRSPSAEKNRRRRCSQEIRRATTRRRCARASVEESTTAPAASVGPSTPSVPTLASAARPGEPADDVDRGQREFLVPAAPSGAADTHRRFAAGYEADGGRGRSPAPPPRSWDRRPCALRR